MRVTNDERSRLDVIEAKLDTLLVKFDYVEQRVGDHESRIRANERWKLAVPASLIMALMAGVGFLIRVAAGG